MVSYKRKAEHYDHSDPFVADDSDDNERTTRPKSSTAVRPTKKSKGVHSTGKSASTTSASASSAAPGVRKDEEGNQYWEISKARRVTVSDFKGKKMVSIREYYEKDGKQLPGKKGISMTIEQFSTFLTILPELDNVLAALGEKLPRPKYGGGPVTQFDDDDDDEDNDEDDDNSDDDNDNNDEDEDDEDGDEIKPGRHKGIGSKKSNKARKKANIEATSDEED